MNVWFLGGAAALAAWIVLAFVVAWPSGLAHVPLAVGVVLLARGIVLRDLDRAPSGD